MSGSRTASAFDRGEHLDRRLALAAAPDLAPLNRAGVLVAADVHVAERLAALAGEPDRRAVLALALAVRAVRLGSVCVDLAVPPGLDPDGDPDGDVGHSWPEPRAWLSAVAGSRLVGAGVLRVDHGLVYLDRYHQQEDAVATALLTRLGTVPPAVDPAHLGAGLDRLFGGEDWAEQREAARAACEGLTTVVTGGPGTGKTTTLARVLALLTDLAGEPLRIGLAAPTGKAAARMSQAVLDAVGEETFPTEDRDRLGPLTASTLHRLLGSRADNRTRFRHDRANPLPHDVVVVDEMSMVPLTLMARLLEAMRPGARLLLVGDPDQLAPVEAGMVLRDLVQGLEHHPTGPVRRLLTRHRFGDEIARLAAAVRDGDGDGAWHLLEQGGETVELLDPGTPGRPAPFADAVVDAAVATVRAAESGDRVAALAAMSAHRLLCAHRDGPYGVSTWNRLVERRLTDRLGVSHLGRWYVGQPLLVTANDPTIGLANGDTGVVLPGAGRLVSLFEHGGEPEGAAHPLTRLGSVVTAHAMTVHRAQGSQFGEVTVLLPGADSRILTRELLYTALTRAQSKVRIVTDRDTFVAAVGRVTERATGLVPRLAVPG